MEKRHIILGILLLLLIMWGGYILFTNLEGTKTPIPTLGGDFEGEVIDTSAFEVGEIAQPQEILGDWIGLQEYGIGASALLENSTLVFREDGTYTHLDEGYLREGFYEYSGDRIFFSRTLDFSNTRGMLQAFAEIQKGELRLVYPQYPRSVVFERG